MVILDTNIIIDHLRQPKGKDTQLKRVVQTTAKENLAVSIISLQELYEGSSTRVKSKESDLITTITPLRILPYNYEVAQLAGEIARDINRPIEFADAAIAATTIINGATLFTLNKKDFVDIADLELLDI